MIARVAGVERVTGTATLAHASQWTLRIPALGLEGAFGVAIAIGALAGLYPAMRAARLSPAEALRAVT